VNGQKLDINWDDDADNPTTAVSDFKAYVGAGYKIIGGTGDSSIADELAPWLRRTRFCTSRARPRTTPSLASIATRSVPVVRPIRTCKPRSPTCKPSVPARPSSCSSDFAFGQSYVTDATNAFKSLGDTVDSLLVPLTTTDFTSTALQVQQDHPDIIFLAWAGTTGAPLMQALSQEGALTTAHVVTGLANIATYPFYGTIGTSFNYLSLYVSAGSTNKPNEYLVKAMEQKYQQPPDLFTPDGFVWAQMLVRAIQSGDGTNVNAMIKGLAGWSFLAPKGEQTIRVSDHAMLQPMYQGGLGSDDQRWLQAGRAAHFECVRHGSSGHGALSK